MITSTTSQYKSSTINSATYNSIDKTLTVVFKWATYVYEAVDQDSWDKFNLADSQGKALNEHIKGNFEYAKYEEKVIKSELSGLVKNITAPGSLLDELPPTNYQLDN
mgnify:CR=1 FL=1|jgi:hypothetical protein|tara:strand:+ start:1155 stop:1475 length:321 start_codon:yes stop_codon:yes gene_type:complete